MNLLGWYRRQTVRRKIFIPFFAITLFSSSLFTVYGFIQNTLAIENEIDKRLLIAAYTLPQLLPPDYFDRVQNPGSIGAEEHWNNTRRLEFFLSKVGGTYRARFSGYTEASAKDACQALKAKRLACMVVRPA